MMNCTYCGEAYNLKVSPCRELNAMRARGICFGCAYFWLRLNEPNPVIIDGEIYSVDPYDYPAFPSGSYFGYMADVTWIDTGVTRTVNIGWAQRIPEHFLVSDTVTAVVYHYMPIVITEDDLNAQETAGDGLDELFASMMNHPARALRYINGRAIGRRHLGQRGRPGWGAMSSHIVWETNPPDITGWRGLIRPH